MMKSKERRISFSRRHVLKLSLGLAGLFVVDGFRRFLDYQAFPTTAAQAVADEPAAYPPGSITPLPELRAWLLRDEGGFYALSGVCTHLGCLVRVEGGRFSCPCHGSQFTPDGAVAVGPAGRPLTHVQVGMTPDGRLVVDATVTVPPEIRLSV
jgi:cytochrome b6-f complex iron-sulfur subunit